MSIQGQILLSIKYDFTLEAVYGLFTFFNKEIIIVTFVVLELLGLTYLKALKALNHLLGLV